MSDVRDLLQVYQERKRLIESEKANLSNREEGLKGAGPKDKSQSGTRVFCRHGSTGVLSNMLQVMQVNCLDMNDRVGV